MSKASWWGTFTGSSEDCLYLNYYVPSGGSGKRSNNNSSDSGSRRRAVPQGGYPILLFWYGGSVSPVEVPWDEPDWF